MTQSKTYKVQRNGNLLWVKAAIAGTQGDSSVFRLLVDTGATYTVLPSKPLASLGYNIFQPSKRLRIVGLNGVIDAPVVNTLWINCLGQRIEDFPLIAYTIPVAAFFDGVLGMDFLNHVEAIISVAKAEISCKLALV